MKKNIYLGDTPLTSDQKRTEGGFVEIQDEKFYRITNYDQMPDFFMTIVSDSNHWMFISSNGSLSAGRKDRDNALFPYYADDKIHDYCGITGSKTIILAEKEEKTSLWEPFSKGLGRIYRTERNLYKSEYGNKIIFEEINHDLDIGFRYGWYNSEKFGFVKKSSISNRGNNAISLRILDGIRNILPHGVDYHFQNEYSNLLDGYKKNELIEETGLGLFTLSSIPVDRAEPSESLNATTVWSYGLPGAEILISDAQTDNFTRGFPVHTETDVRASRGAYFVHDKLELKEQQSSEWMIVAEVSQSTTDVANLSQYLLGKENFTEKVNNDIKKGTTNLITLVAAADGLQTSKEELCSARHFSNTLFNVMRGGIYLNNYLIDTSDLKEFVNGTNKWVSKELDSTMSSLPQEISRHDLIERAEESGSADLLRICYEYLPLTFSRRHGDPSRPWNLFSIETKNDDGSPKSDYQGNWRDIFQNWEALSISYPEFIENIISKFVNASTADGYNPYRIMRNGMDWECPDPDDPWAYIGYWGDHQIIYLQKLLELSDKYHPGKLDELLTAEIFAYANVPYRIKAYKEIRKNPQDTIEFNIQLNDSIKDLVGKLGADGRLLMLGNNKIYHVNLTEKILVTLLAKLSNFIPEAGIWLNTQRPEWNDANNALVGNGVSMVTLYYLRRFLKFWNEKFIAASVPAISISEEVRLMFDSILHLFEQRTDILKNGFSDEERLEFANILGEAGTKYRNTIYDRNFSGKKKPLKPDEMVRFTALALEYIDQSIRVNKRKDGLYHAYNLISFREKGISVRHLYEMLEGQVAVLSADLLTPQESLDVFNALKGSALYRRDQYSYILYPDRQLPIFIRKNNIPANRVKESKLLSKLINDNDSTILSADSSGNYHFNGAFRNSEVLKDGLGRLNPEIYATLLEDERNKVLEIYEEIFDHQSFTGRSGTFYAYEGLGSIYWHMVSKLLLAAEECYFKAMDEGADQEVCEKIRNHYYEIKAGIGLYKSPDLYGAFPIDAYSHTPGNGGAKQPGMTGQVKEDVIARMGELGVRINQGKIVFDTSLIEKKEFLEQEKDFDYYAIDGSKQKLLLKKNQLGFTICQVPVVYTLTNIEIIKVTLKNGQKEEVQGKILPGHISRMIFSRNNEVALIEVSIK